MGLLLAQSCICSSALAAPSLSDQPQLDLTSGVVIGSFSNENNALRASRNAALKLRDQGLMIDTTTVPVQSNGQNMFRVVVTPALGASSRQLLLQLRDSGYSGAWHTDGVPVPRQIARTKLDDSSPVQAQIIDFAQDDQSIQQAAAVDDLRAVPPWLNASPGKQTVYGSEAGIDLHKLDMANFVDAEVGIA
jgi:hypothetical protein